MLTVYGLKHCTTTQKAIKYLQSKGYKITEEIDIRDNPPAIELLEKALAETKGNPRKMMNTSGNLYRELGLKDKLAEMTDSEIIAIMNQYGMLIKRPLITDGNRVSVSAKETILDENWDYMKGDYMKAIVVSNYGDSNELMYTDIAEPQPEANEVRVRLHAAGVNPAEAYVVTGTYAFHKPALPFTPGFDGAGVVDAIGEGVSNCQVGDRVFVAAMLGQRNTGTYAEKVVCDANNVHPLPEDVSFEEGASLGVPATTAYRALFLKAKIRPGETVLVHGASGGVGSIIVQMAQAMGAKVIGTASSEEGRDVILKAGATHAINHVTADNLDEVLKLTNNQGPDVIIEMLANVNLMTDLQMLAKYGRIVIIGNRGSLEFDPRITMGKDADIYGTASWNYTEEEYLESLHAVSSFLQNGLIHPIVGETLPLSDAGKAQKEILDNKSKGKMVLTIA